MKTLSSKERVSRILEHKEADRVPLDIWATDSIKMKLQKHLKCSNWELVLKKLNIDLIWLPNWFDTMPVKYLKDGNYIDMWKIERRSDDFPISHPLKDIESTKDIEKHEFPSPNDINYKLYAEQCRKASDDGFIVCGGAWSPFFSIAHSLIGMDNLFIKLIDIPDVILYLFEKITDFYIEVTKKTFTNAGKYIDIFFTGEDFASQNSLLLSKEMFKKFMKPNLQKIFKNAKDNGF